MVVTAVDTADAGYWDTLAFAVAILMGGGFFALPRTITTTFDLRSREVTFKTTIWKHHRSRTYSFADVVGLGLSARPDGYMPRMKIKNGPSLSLATRTVKPDPNAEILKTVCTGTGLRSLPTGRWGLHLTSKGQDEPG
jgi:hypothetical protein